MASLEIGTAPPSGGPDVVAFPSCAPTRCQAACSRRWLMCCSASSWLSPACWMCMCPSPFSRSACFSATCSTVGGRWPAQNGAKPVVPNPANALGLAFAGSLSLVADALRPPFSSGRSRGIIPARWAAARRTRTSSAGSRSSRPSRWPGAGLNQRAGCRPLGGEAGVGKTRLVAELTARCATVERPLTYRGTDLPLTDSSGPGVTRGPSLGRSRRGRLPGTRRAAAAVSGRGSGRGPGS
jgi:hypothetical protein